MPPLSATLENGEKVTEVEGVTPLREDGEAAGGAEAEPDCVAELAANWKESWLAGWVLGWVLDWARALAGQEAKPSAATKRMSATTRGIGFFKVGLQIAVKLAQ